MNNNKLLVGVGVIVLVIIVGLYAYLFNSTSDNYRKPDPVGAPNVVRDSDGQLLIGDQLVILASSQDIRPAIKELDGTITIFVKETNTYQVKFPVKSLEELDLVAKKLKEKVSDIQVVRAYIPESPIPGGPQ